MGPGTRKLGETGVLLQARWRRLVHAFGKRRVSVCPSAHLSVCVFIFLSILCRSLCSVCLCVCVSLSGSCHCHLSPVPITGTCLWKIVAIANLSVLFLFLLLLLPLLLKSVCRSAGVCVCLSAIQCMLAPMNAGPDAIRCISPAENCEKLSTHA